jgi:hypothetical protein
MLNLRLHLHTYSIEFFHKHQENTFLYALVEDPVLAILKGLRDSDICPSATVSSPTIGNLSTEKIPE